MFVIKCSDCSFTIKIVGQADNRNLFGTTRLSKREKHRRPDPARVQASPILPLPTQQRLRGQRRRRVRRQVRRLQRRRSGETEAVFSRL